MDCPMCGKKVSIKTIKKSRGCTSGMIIFAMGVAITIVIPIVGWVLGPLICISVLLDGGEETKIIYCKKCKLDLHPSVTD